MSRICAQNVHTRLRPELPPELQVETDGRAAPRVCATERDACAAQKANTLSDYSQKSGWRRRGNMCDTYGVMQCVCVTLCHEEKAFQRPIADPCGVMQRIITSRQKTLDRLYVEGSVAAKA